MITVTLANKSFSYGMSLADIHRRKEYGDNPTAKLLPDEEKILRELGIDEEMETRVRAYIPDFFEALPNCQTDMNIQLNKQCEVPYYILWSSLFASRHKTAQRVNENEETTQSIPDGKMAMNSAIIDSLQGKPSTIDSLFTLVFQNVQPSPANEPTPIDTLFTLMIQS